MKVETEELIVELQRSFMVDELLALRQLTDRVLWHLSPDGRVV